jgi:amidophosphoribosyltransferase
LFYQDLEDLVEAVKKKVKGIERFDTSVFNGEYVTGDVSQDYLQHIENLRKDSARRSEVEKDNEVVEIYNTA